jgi:glutathione-independent formaldehyde dehydrogenase
VGDDFVLLADAFTTGYHAAATIDVGPGDSVAIFGAGSVGLLAAYSARLRGAARIYVIDAIAERLEKAGELGAVPIDFLRDDPVEEIRRRQSQLRAGSAFRLEKPLGGVTCAVDAIGFQARSKANYDQEDPYWVTEAIAEIVNPAGRVAITGVWPPKDTEAADGSLAAGKLRVPWSRFFGKNISICLGRDDDERWNRKLRDMIVSGAASPGRVVSHRIAIDDAPNAFAKFDAREDGYIKVVLRL